LVHRRRLLRRMLALQGGRHAEAVGVQAHLQRLVSPLQLADIQVKGPLLPDRLAGDWEDV
jgi:hypothetical protein